LVLNEQVLQQDGLLKMNYTPKQSLKSTFPKPLFMTTLRKLILSSFQKWTSSPEASHARTSAMLEKELESRGIVLHSGNITLKRLAHYDQNSHSLKTCQLSLLGGLTKYSATFPRSGMMRNGTVYQLPPLVRIIRGTESLSWPTPTATEIELTLEQIMKRKENIGGEKRAIYLSNMVKMYPTSCAGGEMGSNAMKAFAKRIKKWRTPISSMCKVGGSPKKIIESIKKHQITTAHQVIVEEIKNGVVIGQLNPTWVEWLMGFPLGWTELNVSEMQSFHNVRKSLQKRSGG